MAHPEKHERRKATRGLVWFSPSLSWFCLVPHLANIHTRPHENAPHERLREVPPPQFTPLQFPPLIPQLLPLFLPFDCRVGLLLPPGRCRANNAPHNRYEYIKSIVHQIKCKQKCYRCSRPIMYIHVRTYALKAFLQGLFRCPMPLRTRDAHCSSAGKKQNHHVRTACYDDNPPPPTNMANKIKKTPSIVLHAKKWQ